MTNERKSTCHAVWIIAHENTERILFLSDLSLQFGNLRVRGVEHLFGLHDVQLRGDTVLETVLCQLDGIFLGFDRVASDLELQVKREKSEIVTRHVAYER